MSGTRAVCKLAHLALGSVHQFEIGTRPQNSRRTDAEVSPPIREDSYLTCSTKEPWNGIQVHLSILAG